MGKNKKIKFKRIWMRSVSILSIVSMLAATVYIPAYAKENDSINQEILEEQGNAEAQGTEEITFEAEPQTEEFSDVEDNEKPGAPEAENSEEPEAETSESEAETSESEAENSESEAETAGTEEEKVGAPAAKNAKLFVTASVEENLISGYRFSVSSFVFRNDGTETIDGITVKSFVSNSGITLDGEDTIPQYYFRKQNAWGFDDGDPVPLYQEKKLNIYLEPGDEISGRIYIPADLQKPYVPGTLLNSTITFSGSNFEDCTTTIKLNVYNPEKPAISFGEYKYVSVGSNFGYYKYDHDISRIDIGTVEIGTDDFTTAEPGYRRKFGIKNISNIKDKYTGDYPTVEMHYEILGTEADIFDIYTGGAWASTISVNKEEEFEFAIKVNSARLMPGMYSAMLHFFEVLPSNTSCNGTVSNGDIYIPLTVKIDGGNNYCRITEAVTGLKVEAGNGYNYISWDPAGGQDQVYFVERMREDWGYYTRLDYDGILGRPFIYDYDIENGIKVSYRVCTMNKEVTGEGGGIWVWSEPVSATPSSAGKSRLMPVRLDTIDDDNIVDGQKVAHVNWTLDDWFDNGDGKDRYAEIDGEKILWAKNTAVDYFYIVMDGKKLVDEQGNLIKIKQGSYKVGYEWCEINEETITVVETYSWFYDVIIKDDYAHSFYVVPVDKKGVEGIASEQKEYHYFDNEHSKPIDYPAPPVDENVHKIIFNGNGGFVRTAYKSVKNGEPYGELSTGVKSGYKIVGWFTAANGGTEVKPEDIVNLTADQTLYAHWVSISHKVTLNPQGGKVTPTSITVIDGETFMDLPTPTYAGHVFEGWYTEAVDGTLITRETIVNLTENITLYARWQITYDVIYDTNGGEMDAIMVQNVIVGKPYGELPVPTRDGYTFMGWYLEKAGEAAVKITKDTIVTEPKQHTLIAYWKSASYMLSFDGNGVDVTFPDMEVSVGMPYGELPTPSKAGLTFEGWFTKAHGGDRITATTKVTIAGNHCLYAHWIKTPYEITFDACGGVVNPSKITVYFDNTPFGELPVPVLAGCTFTGWFTEANGGTQVTAESVLTEEGNLTLYAHWDYKYIAEAPVSDVTPGMVKAGTQINAYSETVNAQIYYTTDPAVGAVLSEYNGMLWEDAFVVNEDVTIYAVAVKPGFKNSNVVSWTYTVLDESEDWGDIVEKDRVKFASADEVPKGIWVAGVEDTEYCGHAVTFADLHVYWGKKMMLEKKDYTLKYSKNVNAGRAQIVITGKGDYTGKYTIFFNIIPRTLGDGYNISNRFGAANVSVAYNGKTQKKTTYVIYNLEDEEMPPFYTELKAGRDFKYVYDPDDDYKSVGGHKVEIVGVGNYVGKAFFYEFIDNEKELVSKLKVDPIPQQNAPLAGNKVEPKIVLRDSNNAVVPEKGYSVVYINNTKPGTGVAVIMGDGYNYTGSKKVTFKIAAVSIKNATVEGIEAKVYSGAENLQTNYKLTCQLNKNEQAIELVENKDYTVRYVNHVNAGKKAAVIFTGMGRFSGELVKYFEIKPYELQDSQIELPANMDAYAYQKNGTTPAPKIVVNGKTLIKDKDYTVKYANNKLVNDATGIKKPCMTITGKGNYAGTLSRTFVINGGDISQAKMSATDIVYANKSGICKPKLTLIDTNGVKLAAGTDYDKTNITYTYVYDTYVVNGGTEVFRSGEIGDGKADVVAPGDIIPAETVIRVTVHGIKNYAGSETSTVFRFVASDISKAKVTVAGKVYTGNDITLTKDDITISYKNVPLEKSDYEIIGYNRNRNSGTAQVILKGTGNYGGIKTVNFKIAKKPIFPVDLVLSLLSSR